MTSVLRLYGHNNTLSAMYMNLVTCVLSHLKNFS